MGALISGAMTGAFIGLIAAQFAHASGLNAVGWFWGVYAAILTAHFALHTEWMKYSLANSSQQQLIDEAKMLRRRNHEVEQSLNQTTEELEALYVEFEGWRRDEAHAAHVMRRIGREISAGARE